MKKNLQKKRVVTTSRLLPTLALTGMAFLLLLPSIADTPTSDSLATSNDEPDKALDVAQQCFDLAQQCISVVDMGFLKELPWLLLMAAYQQPNPAPTIATNLMPIEAVTPFKLPFLRGTTPQHISLFNKGRLDIVLADRKRLDELDLPKDIFKIDIPSGQCEYSAALVRGKEKAERLEKAIATGSQMAIEYCLGELFHIPEEHNLLFVFGHLPTTTLGTQSYKTPDLRNADEVDLLSRTFKAVLGKQLSDQSQVGFLEKGIATLFELAKRELSAFTKAIGTKHPFAKLANATAKERMEWEKTYPYASYLIRLIGSIEMGRNKELKPRLHPNTLGDLIEYIPLSFNPFKGIHFPQGITLTPLKLIGGLANHLVDLGRKQPNS